MTQIRDCGQLGVQLTFSAWGPGGPGAPALPGNPGGPYINKGADRNAAGWRGSFLLLPATYAPLWGMLSRNTTRELWVRPACWAGPTQEALISRSQLLEPGLATQAVPLPLPAPVPPPSPLHRPWPVSLPFQMESHQTELLRAFTHRRAGKAWLALKSLRGEARDSLLGCPSPPPGHEVDRVTG